MQFKLAEDLAEILHIYTLTAHNAFSTTAEFCLELLSCTILFALGLTDYFNGEGNYSVAILGNLSPVIMPKYLSHKMTPFE